MACLDKEVVVYGSVESGKTHPLLQKLYDLHCQIPNLVTFICRKKKVDMRASVLDQWEQEVLPYHIDDPRSPCRVIGGSNPTSYRWKNGGITYIFGVAEAKGKLGARFDAGFVCQAEQLTLEDWEFLSHRCGRAGNWLDYNGDPFGQIWADANPDVAAHWMPKRIKSKTLTAFQVNFKDNIRFYRDGRWTTFGKARTADLRKMITGVRARRLIDGEWASAEGLVFPEFQPDVHVINTLPRDIEKLPCYMGIDHAHSSPTVVGWFFYRAEDDTLISAKEWRYTTKLVRDHAAAIHEHSEGLDVVSFVSDIDPQVQAEYAEEKVYTEDAVKDILSGLELIRNRLRDGRLLLYRDQLIERDDVLEERNAPRDGIEEMQLYRHKPIEKHVGNSQKDDIPIKGDDHWIDLLRYVLQAVDGGVDFHTPITSIPGFRK